MIRAVTSRRRRRGPHADRVCAFLRGRAKAVLVSVVTRFPARLEAEEGDPETVLVPPEALRRMRWHDLLRGIEHGSAPALPVAELCAILPAAVLAPMPEWAAAPALRP